MRFTITNITFIILENKPASKASSDGEKATGSASKASSDGKKATGSATNHFFSKLAIAMTFISIHVNA